MTKIEALLDQLPDAQRKQVEDYAASLLSQARRQTDERSADNRPNRIQLDALDGMLVRMTDDMSDEEIARRVRNAWADAAED